MENTQSTGSTLKSQLATLAAFSGRHVIASIISIVLPVLITAGAYIVLFIMAVVYDGALGSPVALPLLALFVLATSIIYTTLLLFPAVAIAEVASQPFREWRHVMQIPLSTLILAILVATATAISNAVHHTFLDTRQWLGNSIIRLYRK